MVAAATRLAHNVSRLGGIDIPGGGQVVVDGRYAYVGHMKPPHGTSIIDVSDPRAPRVVSTIMLESDASHTHKVRVVGDIMIVNVEENDRHFKRKRFGLAQAEQDLARALRRPPTDAELGDRLAVAGEDIPRLRRALAEGYEEGGFRVYYIANRARPRLIADHRTHGVGVHRFHADDRYAYISTEMEGFVGNILVVYDIGDPARPEEVSRWSMPGQHIAAGETPTWKGQANRLHHALRCGDELWASVWQAGFRVIDATDITNLKTVASHNYHPPIPEPTHTAMPFEKPIGGRRIAAAIDEEHDHRHGRLRGFLWIFDVTDYAAITPLSIFSLGENDSPFSSARGRFGAHQFNERLDGTIVHATWFSGGLRIIDVKRPSEPREVGYYIPEPYGGEPAPQSNDVAVGDDGLIYLIDRNRGLDILQFDRR
jgi:hypothetical protein